MGLHFEIVDISTDGLLDVVTANKKGVFVFMQEIQDEDQRDSGGIIPCTAPKKNAARPQGEWNHFHIINQGDKLTVKLNGELVNEMDLTKAPLASRPKKGPIGFQDHALPVWLKDIKIREL